MAKFTSYTSGGDFNAITFTDDSQRILKQSEDLLKKQKLLSEYRSKNAADLANELNVQFERSDQNRDENYRRRQKQLEINYKIKEKEGEIALQQATRKANLQDAFKKEQDAKKMQALGSFFETAGNIAGAAYEGAIKGAQEKGAADAAAEAAGVKTPEQQMNATSRAVDPLMDAAPPPLSEYVGQTVRDGVQDSVFVAQANEARLAETTTSQPYSAPIQRAFGLDKVYRQAKIKEQALIAGSQFPAYYAKALQSNENVTVNIGGIERTLPIGSPEIQRDVNAKQELLSQLSNRYFKEKGFDKYDPVMMKGYFDKVNPFFNNELNKTVEIIKDNNTVQSLGILKANLNTSAKTVADIDRYVTGSVSEQGVARSKTQIASQVKQDVISVQKFQEYAEVGGWFTGSPPIIQTDEAWVKETVRAAEQAQQTRLKDKDRLQWDTEIMPLLEQARTIATRDGIFTDGDVTVAIQKIQQVVPLTAGNFTKLVQEMNSLQEAQQQIDQGSAIANLDDLLKNNRLDVKTLSSYTGLLDPETLNSYYQKIKPGGVLQPMSEEQKKQRASEADSWLLNALREEPNITPQSTRNVTFAPAKAAYLRKFDDYYYRNLKTMDNERAYEQARIDMQKLLDEDSKRADGMFSVVQPESGGNHLFPRFVYQKGGQTQNTRNQLYVGLVKTGKRKLTDPDIQFLSDEDATTMENQFITGQQIQVPDYAYNIANELGITVEEFVNQQLQARGKTISLDRVSPFTALLGTTADENIRGWLPQRPTQANVQATIALSGNLPKEIDPGPQGYEQVLAAAKNIGVEFPDVIASMWATQSRYGTKELMITDEAGNKMAAGSPREWVEWAETQFQLQKSEGRWDDSMTYRQLADMGAIPNSMAIILEQRGLIDTIPSKDPTPGVTRALSQIIHYETGNMTHGAESVEGEHLHIQQQDNPDTAADETGAYIDQHHKLLNESVLIETGKGSNKYLPPAEWVSYTGDQGYPETEAQKWGADRGGRPHRGYDFRSQKGSKIQLKNGAVVIRVVRNTRNGDEMWVRLKDGTIINFLHGRYVGTKY